MKCYIIPPYVHKELGCAECHSMTKKLAAQRNCIRRFFQSFFNKVAAATIGLNRTTYTMDNTTGTLPGRKLREEGSVDCGDAAIDAAHDNAKIVYDFYLTVLGRNGIDGNGLPMNASAHYGSNYNNAYWNGDQMVYGDGDGELFTEFPKALDVCGHEITHGVVQYGPGLQYVTQSGALNEHLADTFGVTIKQWHLKQDVTAADWLVGPEIVGPKWPGKALRTFKNEPAYTGDPQPKSMKHYKWMMSDNGGVHINSGIPNRLYYEFCLLQGGNSWDCAIKIWYDAMFKLGSWSQFKDLKTQLLASCDRLYGPNSVQRTNMLTACATVGL